MHSRADAGLDCVACSRSGWHATHLPLHASRVQLDHDRRLRVSEFLAGCAAVGVGGTLTEDELRAEFARVDSNGGGVSERAAHSGHSPCAQPQRSPPGLLLTPRQVILFDEFCRWSAARQYQADEGEHDRADHGVDDKDTTVRHLSSLSVSAEVCGIPGGPMRHGMRSARSR